MGNTTMQNNATLQTLANHVRDTGDKELWEAIGEEIQDTVAGNNGEYTGIAIRTNTEMYDYHDGDLSQGVASSVHLTADSREYLNDTLGDRFDIHVVFRSARSGAVVDIVRRRLADAIENAA